MGIGRFVCNSRVLMLALGGVSPSAQQAAPDMSADDALAKLMAGNQRYMRHKAQHPDESLARRKALEGTQHPFAVVLGCADSRVPPELLFDQGLGDLFVIRVAGNIVDDAILGSIEYAVEHLGTKLIVVLGHEKCGAVTAAVEGGAATGHLTALVEAIRPVVAATANRLGDKVHICVIANARSFARQIRQSEPVLKEASERKGLKVVAANYALDTAAVTLLDNRQRVSG